MIEKVIYIAVTAVTRAGSEITIMITIGDKSFKSNIPLESILAVKTKVDMLKRLYGEE